MTSEKIYSEISKLLYKVTYLLASWLEKFLPQLGKSWWEEAVFDKLSYYQQQHILQDGITKLSDLDFAALLRIADKNWFSLVDHGIYLTQAERLAFKDMFAVRNNWAHCPAVLPEKDRILIDIQKLRDFATALDSPRELFMEIDRFIDSIDNMNFLNSIDDGNTETSPQTNEKEVLSDTIAVQSIVRLVKNPDSIGVVMNINNMDDGVRYTVFINGELKTFYQNQIELIRAKKEFKKCSLDEIICRFTAYQLGKPSSTNLYSLNAARIDFVPYQFRPALKIIKSDVPRLLIADSVGVGKTIEAGLILKELQSRQTLDNIVIICPKPLVVERKWELEMKRFGETFTPISGTQLPMILRDCLVDGEWPEKYSRAIIPYSILDKSHLSVSEDMKKNGELGIMQLDPPPHFDLLIVDEAHHIRNSDTTAYKAIKYFADNSDAVVFLTATPIQMGNKDLYTLLNILRPDLIIDTETFRTMAEPNQFINKAIHILRTADENNNLKALAELHKVKDTVWGSNITSKYPLYEAVETSLCQSELDRGKRVELISELEELNSFSQIINRTRRKDIGNFCIRRTETISVYFTEEQRALYDNLIDFISDVLSALHDSNMIKFMTTTLRRQAASSIFGLAPALEAMVNSKLSEFYDDIDFSEIDEDDVPSGLGSFKERGIALIELAKNISNQDPKFDKLLQIVQKKSEEENNKIMIFSSFRHTLSYIRKKLSDYDFRISEINGSVNDEDRLEIRNRFALPKTDSSAIDIVLFTEVGSEGLDYQFCDMMINYDLPWNPMRIEQRIGRIDRRGQRSEFVRICNLVTEETIDADIYHRCLERIGIFEQSIGDCDEILGDISSDIKDALMNPQLSEEERRIKIEQISDNEARRIREIQKLENEENELLAFDVASSINKEIQSAENIWISPIMIQNLVNKYLYEYLGVKQYFQGNGAGLSLRISYESKQKLKEQIRILEGNKKQVSLEWKEWDRYLKSHNPNIAVTFDSDYASLNRNVHFITATHPLVKLAAEYYSDTKDFYLGVETHSIDIPAGEYPFAVYSWKYSGLKPSKKLVPFCNDTKLESVIFDVMQSSDGIDVDFNAYSSDWDSLEQRQYSILMEAINKYSSDCQTIAELKIASLSNSLRNKLSILEQRLSEAEDPKLKTMYQSMINKEQAEFAVRKEKIQQESSAADIYSERVLNGVIIVRQVNNND